ncbi:MAG: 50S ribosomal protein L3 [Dissulfurispiraceae bacterium]|jgi:large subunit ribosomal protein L3|nr:50S ribosomal protein L3 [Dissulfurispiraceae bacterium]
MTGILGKKIGMTSVYTEDGIMVPVTVVEAGPCCVIQVKTVEKDGYKAVKVGFMEQRKLKNITKPMAGVFKKAGTANYKILKEFRMDGLNVGDTIKADAFSKGDIVSVSGISKGKGFQGVMKRHNYKGGTASHGSMFYRAVGSIGASSYPSRVWKGIGMPGQMGNERVTVKALTIVDVKPEQNLILIMGAVPGANESIIEIRKDD